jgi:hypothetical protein
MKYSPTLLAFAALFAIVYGVLFSISYPLVEISGGIVALCVLLGIVTCLAAAAIWNVITRPKTATGAAAETAPADKAAPVLPFVKPPARPSRRRKR